MKSMIKISSTAPTHFSMGGSLVSAVRSSVSRSRSASNAGIFSSASSSGISTITSPPTSSTPSRSENVRLSAFCPLGSSTITGTILSRSGKKPACSAPAAICAALSSAFSNCPYPYSNIALVSRCLSYLLSVDPIVTAIRVTPSRRAAVTSVCPD